MIKKIEIAEALYGIVHAADVLDYDEPMPYPQASNIKKLEACLEKPFASFGNRYLYWTLAHRAAVLFYTIIKNHPLENGNKRSAVIVTMMFLFFNGKTLKATPDQVYELACMVADSPGSQSEKQVAVLKKVFKNFIVDL